MTATLTMTPEMQTLKSRLRATWNAGDYGHFASFMEPGALEFLGGLNVAPGTRLLDVGCGAGQIGIPAARAGAVVTGIDLAPRQIEQARARAEAEGLRARFDEGDAEALPYADGAFDLVVSLFGAMFAPRPERVAAELMRVCRPGGRIVMANWTPQGFVGQFFKVLAQHVPPSPLMPSPALWGQEETARARLLDGSSDLTLTRRRHVFDYPFAPAEVVEFFRAYFGPVNRAFAALGEDGQAALRSDLEGLWTAHNQATDGTTHCDADYLHVVAIRMQPGT